MNIIAKKANVFDIKKYATDDGPGIRTTIFLKGCSLRCWWCHNPEGQTVEPELMYRERRCIDCRDCLKNCPKGAISKVSGQTCINRKLCDLCGKCSQRCPTGALTLVGKKMSVGEVMKEIDSDSAFYFESQGGVTFSGGEPLLQPEFLEAILKECKDRNYNTAVDTSGYASAKAFDRIRGNVDLFLYDIKVMDDEKHKKYTSVSNKLILENFRRLAENGHEIQVRLPLIPGVNDDEDNIKRTADFIISCRIKNTSLLPYHRSGIEKYRNLDRTYKLEEIQTPSDQNLKLIKEKLEALGLRVKIGGG